MGDLNRKDTAVKKRGWPSRQDTLNKDTTCNYSQKKSVPGSTPTTVRKYPASPRTPIRASSRDMDPTSKDCCRACSGKQNNNDWILCDRCDHWYHGILCEGLSDEQLQISVSKKLALRYMCTFCAKSKNDAQATTTHQSDDIADIKNNINKILQTITIIPEIKSELSIITTTIGTIQSSIAKIDDRVTNVENKFLFSSQDEFKSEVKNNFTIFAMDFKAENFQRNLRQKRILISNIPNGTEDDKALVIELASELGFVIAVKDIKTTFRLKRLKAPYSEMLNVEFYDEVTKLKFLDKDIKDKLSQLPASHRFHKYAIWQDRTKMEREDFRALSAEAEKKNNELARDGVTDKMFIVRAYRVTLIKKRTTPDE